MAKAELRNKLDYINSLRGIAVLLVVFTHAGLYVKTSLLGEGLRSVIADASRGVQLFYLLSAFTLFYSLNARKSEDGHRWLDFFLRRLFRIGPLWWISIVGFLYLRSQYQFSWSNILSNAFFIHGFNPKYINSIVLGGWSIAVEMTFYLLIPLFYKLCSNLNRTVICFFWIYLAGRVTTWFLGVHYPMTQQWKEFLFYYLPNQLPVFLLGFALFHIIIRKDTEMRSSGLVHLALFILLAFSFWRDWFITQCVLLFPMVWIVSATTRFPLWNNRVLQYIGKISFSLYLVHFSAIQLVNHLGWLAHIPYPRLQFAMGYLLICLIAIAFSSITYALIEKPGMKMGGFLVDRLDNKSR